MQAKINILMKLIVINIAPFRVVTSRLAVCFRDSKKTISLSVSEDHPCKKKHIRKHGKIKTIHTSFTRKN